jgi:hypothetical protein
VTPRGSPRAIDEKADSQSLKALRSTALGGRQPLQASDRIGSGQKVQVLPIRTRAYNPTTSAEWLL